MAEQLRELLPSGYRVFHDFPGGPNWNVDHVVVGPAGVFAIETKTRRRHNPLPGRRANQVIFNGSDTLEYAWCNDGKAIPQARTNAKSLTRFLTSSTGDNVAVVPLVALPGWFVTLRAKCDVPILSGRQVVGFIQKERRSLDEAQAQRIYHQLEQKCRDVEL
ncbi:MAG: NERD domain-containing protein [Verrucomicrobiales bacterium]|nr:NERD domain-containing protein [Verrucomicrobiales bacterium]